jgi:hypothetical protein
MLRRADAQRIVGVLYAAMSPRPAIEWFGEQ